MSQFYSLSLVEMNLVTGQVGSEVQPVVWPAALLGYWGWLRKGPTVRDRACRRWRRRPRGQEENGEIKLLNIIKLFRARVDTSVVQLWSAFKERSRHIFHLYYSLCCSSIFSWKENQAPEARAKKSLALNLGLLRCCAGLELPFMEFLWTWIW